MDIEIIWTLIASLTVVSMIAGFSLWFLLPKKWIVSSKMAAEILPKESPPPWWWLNKYGKVLYVMFVGGLALVLLLLIVGLYYE